MINLVAARKSELDENCEPATRVVDIELRDVGSETV
jgi:hypothetical protein